MTQYHVTLDGQGYILDLTTYKKSVASPFAAKLSDGEPRYKDLLQSAVWAQSDWRGGISTDLYDAARPTRYGIAAGVDGLQGDVRPGPALTSVFNPAGVKNLFRFATYNDRAYCCRGDGVNLYESSDGTTWTSIYAPGSVTQWRGLGHFDNLLLVGSGNNGEVHSWNGVAGALWGTVAGAPSEISAIKKFWTAYGARIAYLGVKKANGRASLYSATAVPAFTEVAETPYDRIEALEVWDGALWVAAISDTNGHRGALYRYDGTSLDLVEQLADNAITSFAVFNDRLYAGSATRGKLWSVTAQGLTEIFTLPQVASIGGLSAYDQDMRQLLVFHDRLYVLILDDNGLGVYAWDGQGWHLISTAGLGSEPNGITTINRQIVVSNKSGSTARIYKLSTTDAFSGAVFLSQLFDAGVPGADKLLVRLTIRHSALAAGQSIAVDYDLDQAGAFTNLITSSTTSATSAMAVFPAGTTAKTLQLRFTLTMSTTTATPVLEEVLTEYVVMPDAKAEWVFDVLLEGSVEQPLITLDGAADPKTGAQLADTLWVSRARKSTLAFVDLDGESKTVYLRDLEERVAPQSQRRAYSTRARVTLVES